LLKTAKQGESMIISASYRTDIPAFYGEWFLNRVNEGGLTVPNPYSGRTYTVDLRPAAVDGFVFWTKNAAPFRPALSELHARGYAFVVHYTITGLPRLLERSVPDAEVTLDHMRDLATCYGPRALVWRYDPIVITDHTPADWHRARFAALAAELAGCTDEVSVSFMQVYRKTARAMDAAAAQDGFRWTDPADADKRALLADLVRIAQGHSMVLTVCSQPDLVQGTGARPARCIDARRIADVSGRPITARTKANRPGCQCAESRDIGSYDTCPHGCVYCYAVSSVDGAKSLYKSFDPSSPSLQGPAWPLR
jgi:hypothetical protein